MSRSASLSTGWAVQYIGMPWVSGGNGPAAFDCWGLVRHVQRHHFGREVPVIDVDAHDLRACVKAFTGHAERSRWACVDLPQEGDCVLMSQNRQPTHVGIWLAIDGGGVLHAMQGAGVVFSRPAHLRALGYNILGNYRCAQP